MNSMIEASVTNHEIPGKLTLWLLDFSVNIQKICHCWVQTFVFQPPLTDLYHNIHLCYIFLCLYAQNIIKSMKMAQLTAILENISQSDAFTARGILDCSHLTILVGVTDSLFKII